MNPLVSHVFAATVPRLPRSFLLPDPRRIWLLACLAIFFSTFGVASSAPSDPPTVEELNQRAVGLTRIGRFAEALPIAKEGLARREAALDPEHLLIAESLNLVGTILQESDYKAARPLLERALHIRERGLPADHPAIAESLTDLARTVYAGGQFAAARPLLERALRIRESQLGPSSAETAITLTHFSIVLSQLGDLPGSRSTMERALSILSTRENDHPLDLAMALNYYGNILRRQGEFAEARVPLERSLSIRERVLGPDHPHVARTLSRMGMLEAVTGNYHAALPLFLRSLRIHESALGAGHAEVAGDLNEIGSIYLALDHLPEAKQYFERALRVQQSTVGRAHPFVAVTLNSLGHVAIRAREFDQAKSLFLEALGIQERALGNDHIFATETLTSLGYLEIQRGRLVDGTEFFARAARIRESYLGSAHPDVAASVFNWARGLHAQGQYEAARVQYERARRALLSHISANQNLEESAQARVWAQQLKGLYDYELLLSTMAGLPNNNISPDAILTDSFTVAEQARGWVVQLAVARAIARQTLQGTAYETARRLDDLRRQRQQAWSLLTALYSVPRDERQDVEVNRVKKELEGIQQEIYHEEQQLAQLSPRYAELALPKPVGIDVTQSLLASNELLISWLTLDDRICIWLVRTGQPPRYRESKVARSQVNDLVQRVRSSLTPRASGPSDELVLPPFDIDASRELYRLLIGPVAEFMKGVSGLVLVPDTILLPLPLAALVGEGTGSSIDELAKLSRSKRTPTVAQFKMYRDVPWLGAVYNLTVVPSASTLKLIRENSGHGTGQADPFIGFGDPLLQGSGTERGGTMPRQRGTRVQRSDLQALNRLPGTRAELLAIADSLGVQADDHVFLSEEATETRVRRLHASGRLRSTEILAFSTHGLLSGELEGLSQPALVLTPPPTPTDEDDGLLSLEDILTLDLGKSRLVVLSACNTAGGTGSGDSLTGLARAFFFAGARALLVSQWSVDDEATRYLMAETFKSYGTTRDMTPSEALRRGMSAIIQEAARTPDHAYFAHPFSWAAFFVVGDGTGGRLTS